MATPHSPGWFERLRNGALLGTLLIRTALGLLRLRFRRGWPGPEEQSQIQDQIQAG